MGGFSVHCENSFGINSNYLSLKECHNTVRNKIDLDRGIKTKSEKL